MQPDKKRKRRTLVSQLSRQTMPALIALPALLSAILLLPAPPECLAAVVRPTNFLGLNPQETTQVTPHQQQQSQNNQQLSSHSNAPLESLAAADQGPQTPSTKINPYKSRFCTSLAGAKLDSPLGLHSMAIDDLALSASSYSNEQVGPHLARLNLDIAGGAWCPVKPISGFNFGKEWIQAKLNRSYVISAIETQGRYGMGNGKEFVPSYQVEYSRNGGLTWHKWKDFRGSSLLRGNDDVNSAVKNELSPPIVGANVIRILPYSQHLRTVCLRFELHGCTYDEGAPIAYATSDGVVEPRWGHLIDYTYDGLRMRGLLSNGLGQLVDGVKGPDDFALNNGFEWVGWKAMNGDVIIEFTFKTLRNFTGALFHSNNRISSGVEVFQAVDVHYGIDVPLSFEALKDSLNEERRRFSSGPGGALSRPSRQLADTNNDQLANQLTAANNNQMQTLWSPELVSIEYEPDKKVENSRPVTVHLKQRLANKLRFVLKFASKWILVSEVEFLSQPVELMSLASLSQEHTPALMGALQPAKSYDEYVAILREHQLRRIATNAFLQSFGSPVSSTTAAANLDSPAGAASTVSDQPLNGLSPDVQSQGSIYDPSVYAPRNHLVTGPAIPTSAGATTSLWLSSGPQQQQPRDPQLGGDPVAPATNPMLNQPFAPAIYPSPGGNSQTEDSFGAQQQDQFLNQKERGPQVPLNGSRGGGTEIGLVSLISLVVVAVLVLLGLLFAVSSYRLRHESKMATPGGATLGHSRHLPKALAGPGFMGGVFGTSLTGAGGGGGASGQVRVNSANHYNAIFATQARPNERATSTLRRLATLAGNATGAACSSPSSSTITHKGNQPLLFGQQHQQANQLLVSLKDSSNTSRPVLFGQTLGGKGANYPQAVNTQLIVGLNNQQQIYNNSSNMNCNTNQTYATLYSTSMSMASSSTTTGHQGDYADYAIPDAQPMIPPVHHQYNGQHQQQQQAQQQHHLNHAFNGSHHASFRPSGGQQQLQQRQTNQQNPLIL